MTLTTQLGISSVILLTLFGPGCRPVNRASQTRQVAIDGNYFFDDEDRLRFKTVADYSPGSKLDRDEYRFYKKLTKAAGIDKNAPVWKYKTIVDPLFVVVIARLPEVDSSQAAVIKSFNRPNTPVALRSTRKFSYVLMGHLASGYQYSDTNVHDYLRREMAATANSINDGEDYATLTDLPVLQNEMLHAGFGSPPDYFRVRQQIRTLSYRLSNYNDSLKTAVQNLMAQFEGVKDLQAADTALIEVPLSTDFADLQALVPLYAPAIPTSSSAVLNKLKLSQLNKALPTPYLDDAVLGYLIVSAMNNRRPLTAGFYDPRDTSLSIVIPNDVKNCMLYIYRKNGERIGFPIQN